MRALIVTLVASAVTHADADTTAPGERMNIWVGRWQEVVQTKETPYSHAASVPSHLTCAWSADRGFMVCEYLSERIDPNEGKPSNHLSIFTYDDKSRVYKHLGISKDYKTLEETPVIIDGNIWHYNYEVPAENGKKLDLRDSYEFVTAEKRITRIELSVDGGQHWILMSESVATKVL